MPFVKRDEGGKITAVFQNPAEQGLEKVEFHDRPHRLPHSASPTSSFSPRSRPWPRANGSNPTSPWYA